MDFLEPENGAVSPPAWLESHYGSAVVGHFCRIAEQRPELTTSSVVELAVHSLRSNLSIVDAAKPEIDEVSSDLLVSDDEAAEVINWARSDSDAPDWLVEVHGEKVLIAFNKIAKEHPELGQSEIVDLALEGVDSAFLDVSP